nr:E3 ubiquitin-protein ligase listerin [Ipomoea batatas]
MMEEVAENANDAIAHTSSSRNLEMTLEMLEKPVSHLAFGTLRKESSSDEDASNNQDYRSPEPFAEENIHLREDISSKLENFPTEVLEMDLLSSEQKIAAKL